MHERPIGVTILGVAVIVVGVLASLTWIFAQATFATCSHGLSREVNDEIKFFDLFSCVVIGPLALSPLPLFIATGIGLLLLKQWAWWFGIFVSLTLATMGLITIVFTIHAHLQELRSGLSLARDFGLGLAYLAAAFLFLWYLLRRDVKTVFGLKQKPK